MQNKSSPENVAFTLQRAVLSTPYGGNN